jgi:hypothetical protein
MGPAASPTIPVPSPATSMSQNSPEASPSANYQAIFDSALEGYKKKTEKDLSSDSLLRRFETCDSPDAILAILREEMPRPGRPQNGGDKLLTLLNPTIKVLGALSETISGVVGLVSPRRPDREIWTDPFFRRTHLRG